jgi:ATP-dependent RNA helicase DDX24/MAK5
MGSKKRQKNREAGAWDSLQGWKQVEVGDELLVGSDHFGFMGLEELDPSEVGNIESLLDTSRLEKRDDPEKKVKQKGQSKEDMLEYIAKLERENAALKSSQNDAKKTKKKTKRTKKNIAKEEKDKATPDTAPAVDVSAWQDYHLEDNIVDSLSRLGFSAPTQIQAECLPSAIRDRMDIIGAAQTGSGKTLAFGLPMLTYLSRENREKQEASKSSLKGLVLVPTRELCMQVSKALDSISRDVGIRVVPIVGGISHQKQERLISKHPPEIVVATPGRYWELVSEGHTHLNDYSGLKFLVLDEADKMVQQGHFEELTSIFHLVSTSSATFQTFVFSATLTLPSELKRRLKKGGGGSSGSASLEQLMDAVPFSSNKKPKVIDISPEKRLAENITESYVSCPEKERDAYVYCLLAAHPGRTIVFVNAISSVRRLGAVLKLLGLPVKTLHAGMQQRARLKALDAFSNNEDGILVATDVAARGIDVKNVKCVIHYQIPATADTYVHRSGRTARAEEDGISIAFVTPKEHGRFRALLHSIGTKDGVPEFPIDLSLMEECRKRAGLAIRYDSLARKDSKSKADKSWKQLNAEQLGIVLSDEEEEDTTHTDHDTIEASKLKMKLDTLLAEPLQPKFSKKFMFGGALSGIAISKKLSSETDMPGMIQSARTMALDRKRARETVSNDSKNKKLGQKSKPKSRKEALAEAVSKHLAKKAGKRNRLVVANPFGRNKGVTALQAMKNLNK